MDFQYSAYSHRKYLILLIGALVVIGLFFVDFLFSTTYLNAGDIWNAFIDRGSAPKTLGIIVWDIKLPIVCTGLVVGAAFGFAGVVMQTLLNNPLASPYTLGISAGAGFGASLAMVAGLDSLALLGAYMVPASAFFFALLSSAGIFLVAKAKGFSAEVMVLAGIGLVFLFQALQSLMQYLSSPDVLSGIVFWTFGSLSSTEWTDIAIILVLFLICFVAIYRKSWALTAMKLGDHRAAALGIDTGKMRKWMFLAISMLTAVCVAFVGCIGFVGIVGPHVARMILGEDQRFLIPMSCICGSVILLCADFVCRIITEGIAYPIGIFTAIVGVPFFFYLLLKKKAVKQ